MKWMCNYFYTLYLTDTTKLQPVDSSPTGEQNRLFLRNEELMSSLVGNVVGMLQICHDVGQIL